MATRTGTLIAFNDARGGASPSLADANVELERRVAEQASALEAAARDLEAFTYSVSHDLRAPLRGVDGFSQVLLEEHSAGLPAEAQRYLRLVREGAQRMGAMIDGLVGLERIGRVHLSRQVLDSRALVLGAIEDLRPAIGDRDVEFRVGDLPACNADPALLRSVFENLIDNAVKFTRDREHGIVEIGADASGRERAFSVRDNGCGFDPGYADHLFGVFQRLHRADEYDGLGIGLATAHRIITRHGGHLWAESQVGAGTAFRFTLGAGAVEEA